MEETHIQNTVYWVDINFALKKGIKHDRTLSFFTKSSPAYCIPKVVRMETGDVIYEKVYTSPRPPPKVSLKHDWMKILGSEVARQSEGEVARQAKSSQSSQSNPHPHHDRTVKPVVRLQRRAPHSQEIKTRSFPEEAVRYVGTGNLLVAVMKITSAPTVVCSEQASHPRFSREGQNLIFEDEINHDRTGKPVVCRDANHECSMLNEVDIDFRIPGLPHSVAKQADNYRVRELVKKIENHPHRQSLQQDLQQNNAYNPFSEKSTKMIKDMDNVELFELFETEPKMQCKERLLYGNLGIIYCTCGHLLKES